MYELKQSSRMWYNTLVDFFQKKRFFIINVDYSVFVHNENRTIIIIYVNDLLIIELSKVDIARIKT